MYNSMLRNSVYNATNRGELFNDHKASENNYL